MAFCSAPARLPTSKKTRAISSSRPFKYATRATAAPAPGFRIPQSVTKPHKKRAAHVVDSRVATRVEAHHWITVKNNSRIFERAAVAQADVTRQIEARNGCGALHRWVLRQVADPTQSNLDVSFSQEDSHYVVMEAFTRGEENLEQEPIMRRWLSAVERVGPLMNTVDIRSLRYENVFTSKVHDVQFDPNNNIVVVESINVDMSQQNALGHVVEILRDGAEASVTAGDCLEFCVLHRPGEQGFFKTVEIYKDVDALKSHMNGFDQSLSKRIKAYTTRGHRSRRAFKPVVFA